MCRGAGQSQRAPQHGVRPPGGRQLHRCDCAAGGAGGGGGYHFVHRRGRLRLHQPAPLGAVRLHAGPGALHSIKLNLIVDSRKSNMLGAGTLGRRRAPVWLYRCEQVNSGRANHSLANSE
eukprot:2520991-Pyramimonas_sp.AAC.1